MLKLPRFITADRIFGQPPSGGCVLKPVRPAAHDVEHRQPPSGGCVLKHISHLFLQRGKFQPPSGGCVLKPGYIAY